MKGSSYPSDCQRRPAEWTKTSDIPRHGTSDFAWSAEQSVWWSTFGNRTRIAATLGNSTRSSCHRSRRAPVGLPYRLFHPSHIPHRRPALPGAWAIYTRFHVREGWPQIHWRSRCRGYCCGRPSNGPPILQGASERSYRLDISDLFMVTRECDARKKNK